MRAFSFALDKLQPKPYGRLQHHPGAAIESEAVADTADASTTSTQAFFLPPTPPPLALLTRVP
eukprot:2726876-Pleurochrysis_carterae.AAC.1